MLILKIDKLTASKNIHKNKDNFIILFVAFESVTATRKKSHASELGGVNGVAGGLSGSSGGCSLL
jgi:uncharacterized membrane protein